MYPENPSRGFKLKFLALTVILTALSIYSFALGSLRALSIPEPPSITSAVGFFIQSLTSRPESISHPLLGVPLALIFILLSMRFLRKDRLVIARCFLAAGFAMCLGPALLAHRRGLFVCTAVFVPVAIAVLICWSLMSWLEKSKSGRDRYWIAPLALFSVLFLALSAPYEFAARDIEMSRDLTDRYTQGFTESSEDTIAFLLWVDNGRYFWLSCELDTIYGDWSGQQVFYETNIPDDLRLKFCHETQNLRYRF